MLNDKVIRAMFIISLAGHCLFLGMPRFNLSLPLNSKKPKEIIIQVEIEKPSLLPRIDVMGEEKKLANSKLQIANCKSKERINDKQLAISDTQVIDPAQPIGLREAMLRYQDMVKQRIEEARRYPSWAKRQRIEGTVDLNFVVLANGLSKDIKIIFSSGSALLDAQAVATIQKANPFPPIPKEINISPIQMEVSILFTLK